MSVCYKRYQPLRTALRIFQRLLSLSSCRESDNLTFDTLVSIVTETCLSIRRPGYVVIQWQYTVTQERLLDATRLMFNYSNIVYIGNDVINFPNALSVLMYRQEDCEAKETPLSGAVRCVY